jgi:hypothetical protein
MNVGKLLKFAVLMTASCTFASAAIIFSDNFNSGVSGDWTLTTNYVPGNGTANLVADANVNVSPPDSLGAFLFLPGGDPSVFNIFVRASHAFTTSDAGDHILTLSAMSAPCQGCTISYEVLVDGSSVVKDNDLSFQSLMFTLSGLVPGDHTLTLGMFTDVANNGKFIAWFDDVSITGPEVSAVPEPSTMSLLLGGFGLMAFRRRR